MALEDQVAQLVSLGGQNLALPQQIKNEADAQIARVGAAFAANAANATAFPYVDQTQGSDTAEGSEAAPLRTIKEALKRTAVHGSCFVRLLSDYHIDGEHIEVIDRRLDISSATSVRRTISHQPFIGATGGTSHKDVYGFLLTRSGHIAMSGVVHVLPGDPAGSAGLSYGLEAALVRPRAGVVDISVSIRAATIQRAANATYPMLRTDGRRTHLDAIGVAFNDQPMGGYWLQNVAAGTDPATLDYLTTNLGTL